MAILDGFKERCIGKLSGKDAIELVRERLISQLNATTTTKVKAFHIIVVDFQMPVMNGAETWKCIREAYEEFMKPVSTDTLE